MRRKLFRVGTAWRLLVALILALCLVPIDSSPAAALDTVSVGGYFEITYEPVEFSKTEINGSEIFSATVEAEAACTNDLPLTVTEARITARVTATHQTSGTRVILNPSYTVTISSFPNKKGETSSASQDISLQFPEGSQSGTYSVVGELIEARVNTLIGWLTVTSFLPSSQTMGSVTYVAPGGGGGFGPVPPPTGEEVKTNLFGTEASSPISSSGEILETIEATSKDGMLTLTIREGTIALDIEGEPLETLTAAVEPSPPEPPEDVYLIGAYNFGPDGATFKPTITLTWSYDPNDIPEGVAEEDLVLAWYDEVTDKWVELDCVVDTRNNTITASIEHFTTFAIIGAAAPPEPTPVPVPVPAIFTSSSLSISPVEVNIGDEVTISLLVTNTGGKSGSYQVTLKINGEVAAAKEATVNAGLSKEVAFTISKDMAGTYLVDVNGVTDSFVVREAAATPEPESESEPALTSTPPPMHTPPPVKPINWPVICGVVAAVVAMGSLLFFLARQRHTKSSS